MAKLYFKYGAMNSGKSTLIIQAAHNYEENGMKVALFKPKRDTKGEDMIVSRIGVSRMVDSLISDSEDIFKLVKKKYKDVSSVLIDEANFLMKEQVDQLMRITNELNIAVICYGIRTDFLTHGFPGSTRLLEIAHVLDEIKTMCRCGRKATYNARYVGNRIVTHGDQIAIDGVDGVRYISLCSKCYEYEIDKEKNSK
jgi:Thymidine kinase